jgi:hypothetical protein
MTRIRLFLLAAITIVFARSASAEDVVKAVYVNPAPKIDGRLDDKAWKEAASVTRFYQREPKLGAPVSEETEFLVCYDHDFIYFGFRCGEKDPSLITAKEMARDVSLGEDDRVQVILDTFLDKRTGYWFQIGPRGSIGDALVADNGADFNKQWDGLWEGKARIHDKGWDAEIAIPFKTLGFRPGQTRWGMKLIRNIRRKLEASYWPVANTNTQRFQVSDAGTLEGLEGITQGIGLDVSPYGIGGVDLKSGAKSDWVGDAGFDAFYQITPALKSALTVNTDFAQTEVDTRQVNLTRFPLFFPEKRDFFLDGANYFTFGPTGEQLIPFFSRRIGLDESGNPIPIVWGGKLAGQAGPWNLGVMNVMDERDDGNRNFTVARVRRNLGKQSSIGMIGTHGNALSAAANSVLGVDLKLASSTFRRNKNIAFTLFGLKSGTEGVRGDDTAFGAEFSYPNDFLNVRTGFRQIDRNFVAGVGFVPRSDIRESYFQTTVGPRPKRWGIMQAFFRTGIDYITDHENRLLTRTITLTPLDLLFRSGDIVTFSVSPQHEYLDKAFQIHPFHQIGTGKYDFLRWNLLLQTAPRRNFWASATRRWGSFYDGTRRDIALAFGYKVAVPLFVGVEHERNRVELPDGFFSTNVSRLNLNVLFGPDASVYSFLQYDNRSKTLGWQSRFRWIIEPGNEILFVWNSRTYDPLERFELTEGSARFKIRYNHRF